MEERLAKFIAAAGICSRRQAEKLILAGEIIVDNKVVITPVMNVSNKNIVKVRGDVIKYNTHERLWIYYKPIGVITTHNDPQKRQTVFGLLRNKLPRVISVGRLDLNSEGLLLLTNCGKLAHKMELPKSNIERTYLVKAYGDPKLVKFDGKPINIKGITYNLKSIKLIKSLRNNPWFEVILKEGKNREIRKIFEYFGLKINRLIRTKYGKYKLGQLKPGEYTEVIINNEYTSLVTR